jgi:hypothetical protein
MRRAHKLTGVVLALAMLTAACGPSDIQKVERSFNRSANSLNAIAKTNRELYRQNVINLADRQRVATIVNRSNSLLDKAVDRAYAIDTSNPTSVQVGKDQIVMWLNEAITELRSMGVANERLQLAVQTAIAIVQETISLVNALKAKGAQ